LDRMAGHDAGVETVEPARARVVPWTVFSHGVVVDAVALRISERRVGDLEHSDRARRGPVQLEGVPAEAPAPARARDGMARAFDLGERGEQLGRDHGGGMLAKGRPVPAPGFRGRLYERTAYRKNHLGGLADRLDYPVCRAPERQDGDRDRENPN